MSSFFTRITRLKPLAALLLVPVLGAQSSPPPVSVTERLDTPQARVIVATLRPHMPIVAKGGHATHRVLVYLDDGAMTRKEGEQSTSVQFRRGDVRWRPSSGAYISENTTDHPVRILEIDLKGPPTHAAAVTQLDPAVVDGSTTRSSSRTSTFASSASTTGRTRRARGTSTFSTAWSCTRTTRPAERPTMFASRAPLCMPRKTTRIGRPTGSPWS